MVTRKLHTSNYHNCNNLVVGWLLCNMEPDLADLFIHYENAGILWQVIKERYDQPNDVAYYLARRNLSTCVQGEESVTNFFSRIQLALDEIDKNEEQECSCPPCTCKTKKGNRNRLVSFILGLNDSYSDLKGQITRMSPRPTLDVVYSMALMEEQKRSSSTIDVNNTTLAVTPETWRLQGKKDRYCQQRS